MGTPLDHGEAGCEEATTGEDAGEDAGGTPVVETTIGLVGAGEGELVLIAVVEGSWPTGGSPLTTPSTQRSTTHISMPFSKVLWPSTRWTWSTYVLLGRA